jgi:hypothetical protein
MALDLESFRLKITRETEAWLVAEARTTGKSKQEIARDALHEIALRKIHAAKVLARLAPDDGIDGADGGRRR